MQYEHLTCSNMQDHVLHCMYVKKCQQQNSDEHESEQEISKEHNNIFMVCSHGSCDEEWADCWMLDVGCWNSFILDKPLLVASGLPYDESPVGRTSSQDQLTLNHELQVWLVAGQC